MSITIIISVLVFYLASLFWVASYADKHQFVEDSWTKSPWIYALALGVYCTSWTFYGLVGTAASKGWGFLPILLGPFLLFVFGQGLLSRISTLCKQENVRSIADFFAARYGKRRGIATCVTLIVLVSTIPYIALQIKAVSDSFLLVSSEGAYSQEQLGLFTAAAMIVFALVFGVKRLDTSGYHAGLMSAVAFESAVKLLALFCLAIFASLLITTATSEEVEIAYAPFQASIFDFRFVIETLVSAAAILCLPRMFHVTFVENLSGEHLRKARFIFPLYLAVIALCVYIAALAGNAVLSGGDTSGDAYVIFLPLSQGHEALSLLILIGGFSAATAMIIVASVTLSHMLSNDVILPVLIQRNTRKSISPDYSRSLILARRLTVILVIGMAYVYQRLLAGNAALTDIGLIAFALVVQLAPPLLFGLYSLRGNAIATYAGLASGCSIWLLMLMLPLLSRAGVISDAVLVEGLFGISWLRPEYFLNFTFSDAFTRGVVLSLSGNILVYWLVAQWVKPNLSDRIQARAFLNLSRAEPSTHHHQEYKLDDVSTLLTQFLGESVTEKLIANHRTGGEDNEAVNPELLSAAEHGLSGIVGVASARAMLATLKTGDHLGVEDVVNIFEETTRALRFNQDMIVASFESISSAISVANEELKLVSWNRRYEEMFDYPEGMLRVGAPIDELVRFNAERGMLGSGAVDDHVQKRLNHLKSGKGYRVVRNHGDCVIEIKGSPLPNGGYVTTYDDISEFISAQDQLEKTNEYLERRVKERTLELEAAQKEAENVNRSKSRFLALASHDILQPLNAANLYVNILLENARKTGDKNYETVEYLHQAIESSESIISTLLEISKLDTGALSTEICDTDLHHILSSLVHEFDVQLEKDIELRFVDTKLMVRSDPRYLRRILQNFLSNAVKYTQRGKILVGCKRRGRQVEIGVIDTGPGIHPEEQQRIFEDFYRSTSQQTVKGLGLGLAVATRFSNLLGHDIRSSSRLGCGSSFSVLVPLAVSRSPDLPSSIGIENFSSSVLAGARIFYLDDDGQNIHAMETLLRGWECLPTTADTVKEAVFLARSEIENTPDLLLMDWQLDQGQDGISAAKQLHDIWGVNVPTCIVSASQEPDLSKLVASHGFEFLRKPIKPGKLRAILEQMLTRSRSS
ncbi:MAG: PAS-domain containing protein [Agarilytica sp.]